MSIYVFSLLSGYELSGVDIAQGRRAEYFRKLNTSVKYVFNELPNQNTIDRYVKCGIQLDEMLSVHMKLSGAESLAGNYPVDKKISELSESMNIDNIVSNEKFITLYKNGMRVAVLELKEDSKYVLTVQLFDRERLIVKEFYTDRLLYAEHYVTADKNGALYAKLIRKTFIDERGRVTCECLYEENGEMYVFPNGECLTKYELIEKFIIELNLTEKDIIIIDRPSNMNYVQPLFSYGSRAYIMVFLHSGHYFKKGEAPEGLYINCEYYGWFKYSKNIDVVIVSTEEQKIDLEEKYRTYQCYIPRIEVIPASGLDEIRYPEEERKDYSLLTVSRIDERKNIKWIIESVIRAKKILPNLFFDIYGTGNREYMNSLIDVIRDNNADAFISFKGKMDVSEIYKKYEAYISASLWETLGLSCMEAVGSGNAMIGLNVRYGNRLFIRNNINGKLIDFSIDDINKEDTEEITIEKMKEAIVDVFQDKDVLLKYHNNSYNIAREYMNDRIEKKWLDLLGEYINRK